MTDQANNLMIPAAKADDLDLTTMSREQVSSAMRTAGAEQQSVVLDELAEANDAASAELAKYMQPGETLLQAAERIENTSDNTGADPARRALNKARAAATSLDSDLRSAANPVDPNASTTNVRDPEAHVRSVRDNEMEAEAIRIARAKGIPTWKAAELLQVRIKADGIAAVLPRTTAAYARYGVEAKEIQIA